MARLHCAVVAALALAACSGGGSDKPVTISIIAGATHGIKLASAAAPAGQIVLATSQGLVGFDAEGQIEPALAERWSVFDDGMSVIFRIRRAKWADGRDVTSVAVAQSLQRAMAADSRNRLKPLLGSVAEVIPMTGQVLEIQLKSPQPEFLQLLAQPDLAIFAGRLTNGSGRYAVHSTRDNVTRLRPVPPEGEKILGEDQQRDDIRIRREAASLAIARFAAREIALVTGGGFAELPLVRPAGIATSQFSVDPAYGLFGLAAVKGSSAVAKVNVRRALAMAIDRERLVGSFGVSNWQPQYAALPNQLDSASPPAALEWVKLSFEERLVRAKAYLADAGRPPIVRVALPSGPGARLLFAALAADWRRIGVSAVMVPLDAPADLQLIDEVAPQRPALWYLMRLSCARGLPCIAKAETALVAAASALKPADRSAAIAEADAALASDQSFIPLALPLRWSLVSPELTGWRVNAFAIHPLHHLREQKR